jgi:hypothetical protein
MGDVYKNCPEYENEDYLVRMVCQEDKMDLLKVYSDKRAVPFFNSDNCGGDDFYYTTESRMEPAYGLFHCDKIATKALPSAAERIAALKNLGFIRSEDKLIGHDGTKYDSYFVLKKN